MKYKKFKHWAIMPLWVKIIFWIDCLGISLFLLLPLYCVILFIIEVTMQVTHYGMSPSRAQMSVFFIGGLDGADAGVLMLVLGFFLLPIIIVSLLPCLYIVIKFKSGKFKLSDIKNPEKYDPNDIRKYFPEYRSKKEKMESNNKNEQINQKEQ